MSGLCLKQSSAYLLGQWARPFLHVRPESQYTASVCPITKMRAYNFNHSQCRLDLRQPEQRDVAREVVKVSSII